MATDVNHIARLKAMLEEVQAKAEAELKANPGSPPVTLVKEIHELCGKMLLELGPASYRFDYLESWRKSVLETTARLHRLTAPS